jgi:hypothetical protein
MGGNAWISMLGSRGGGAAFTLTFGSRISSGSKSLSSFIPVKVFPEVMVAVTVVLVVMTKRSGLGERAESRAQRAEHRKQKADSREQRACMCLPKPTLSDTSV